MWECIGLADERDIVVEGGNLCGREMQSCGNVAQGVLQIAGVVDADDGFACVSCKYFRNGRGVADVLRAEAEAARNGRIDGIDGVANEMGVFDHGFLQDAVHDMRVLL